MIGMNKSVLNMVHLIEKMLTTIIWTIIAIVVVWMTIVCGNCSARVDYGEHSYIIRDNIYVQFLLALVVLVLLSAVCYVYLLCKSKFANFEWQKSYIMIRNVVLLIVLVTGLVFVLASQKAPRADQLAVVTFAYTFRNNDYSGLNPGGYLDLYHNQFGIVLILYYLSFIFGDFNYIAFQIFNTIALTITYWALSCIIESRLGKKAALIFLLMALLFLPASLYLTFIYGTIIGLMFCAVGFLFLLRFIDTDKWIYLWLAGVMSTFAIFIKQNYLIFIIGLFAFCFFETLKILSKKTVIAMMVTILALVISSMIPTIIIEKVSSMHADGGVSSWSFIAMGLQDNDLLYDGWWNNYNVEVYGDVGFNTEELTRISKEYILNRLDEFTNNLKEGISFFSRKNASQWANPDFQGFWINWLMPNANTELKNAKWIENLFSLTTCESFYSFLNTLQFIIFLGTAFYIIIGKKNTIGLYFAIIFLGGVIFHTFWEAKSQYTLPYFIYIIPLASMGWVNMSQKCIEVVKQIRKTSILNKSSYSKRHVLVGAAIVVGLTLLVVVQSKKIDILNSLFVFDQYNDQAYYEFLNNNTTMRFRRGRYNIASAVDESIIAGNGDTIVVSSIDTSGNYFEIKSFGDYSLFRFSDTNQYLDVPEGVAEEGKNVQLYSGNDSIAQRWRISDAGDGMVYILYKGDENYVLSADPQNGQIYLSKRENTDNQKWLVRKLTSR